MNESPAEPAKPLLSPARAMWVLALPVLAEESLNLLVGYTDWFLAGRFLEGDEPLAAMGLMAYFMWVLPSLFSFVGIGALAVIARLIGEGNRGQANHVTCQALVAGLVLAAVVIVAVLALGPSFVAAMQYRGEAARLAVRYIWIVAPAVPLIMFEQVGTACLRGAGDTVSGLVARVAVNIVDIVLSAALVTGIGPFPNLGWEGLAVGTTCGHAVGGLIILIRLLRGGGGVTIGRGPANNSWKIDLAVIRRILRVGLPGGFDIVAVIVCHLIYVAVIGSLGTAAQAAHGLGVQIEALSYLPGSAFAVAAATLAGQSLGAKDHRRAVRGVLLCVSCALAIMTVAGMVLYFGGHQIALVFTGEEGETTQLTGSLLKIVALSCPSLAILMVLLGALRGAGDTAWSLAVTVTGLVCVRIPGACLLAWEAIPIPFTDYWLPGLGLGVAGAWYAMVVDVMLRSVMAAARFIQGGWKKVRV